MPLSQEHRDLISLIKDVSAILASASLIVACASYLLQKRLARLMHERAEKEKAISIVGDYARSMSSRTSAVRKLLRELNDDTLQKLDRGDSFKISRNLYDLLHAAIPEATSSRIQSEDVGSEFTLSRRQSFLLRWEVLSKLNAMEVVAHSWLIAVVHRETVEKQMMHLLEPEHGRNILTVMRGLAHVDGYPALHSLMQRLEARRPPQPIPRPDNRPNV